MLAEADIGLTNQALDNNNNRNAGDEMLLVKYFYHPRLNQSRTTEEGRAIYEDQIYIQIMQPGNKDSIVIRPATEMDKRRFPMHLEKFLARESTDGIEGTLLEQWPGITRSQIEEFKYMNIRTVEQLVGMSDSNSQGIMGINILKERARKFLEASETSAAADKILAQEQKMEEMQAQIEALVAKLAAQEDEPPKRKRRTKAEMEAARAE